MRPQKSFCNVAIADKKKGEGRKNYGIPNLPVLYPKHSDRCHSKQTNKKDRRSGSCHDVWHHLLLYFTSLLAIILFWYRVLFLHWIWSQLRRHVVSLSNMTKTQATAQRSWPVGGQPPDDKSSTKWLHYVTTIIIIICVIIIKERDCGYLSFSWMFVLNYSFGTQRIN